MNKTQLAEKLASGLAGWFQVLATQSLHIEAGEESARMMAVQILNAQNRFIPETSQLPPNWTNSRDRKYRIDICIKGTSPKAQGWYGAVEMKWPGASIDLDQTRQAIVEDVTRLTFVITSNLCANLFILGAGYETLTQIFDTPHPRAKQSEEKRKHLCALLSRDLKKPEGCLKNTELTQHFANFGGRVPSSVFKGFDGKLKTVLLASATVMCGTQIIGFVYVWHCKRTRGTKKSAQP